MKRDDWYKVTTALLLFLALLVFGDAYAGTCTSISRTNYSANQVLTSTSLNSQLNTVYNAANALDAGCLTDGTLELAAINTSEWAVALNSIREGCEVTRSDADTLSVDRCSASVNGAFVAKSSATTATWGCEDCSAQVVDTTYYIYMKTGSTGSTLNLLISTSAPNGDGYDGSGNRILAKFYNDTSGDIDQYSITQWKSGSFENKITDWATYTPTVFSDTTPPTKGTTTTDQAYFRRVGQDIEVRYKYFAGTAGAGNGTGTLYYIGLPESIQLDTTKLNLATGTYGDNRLFGGGFLSNGTNCDTTAASTFEFYPIAKVATGVTAQFLQNAAGNSFTNWGPGLTSHAFDDANTCFQLNFKAPVKGWD